jgi:hypothetical protein
MVGVGSIPAPITNNMRYFKRKDGSVFGKENPTKEQLKFYKKEKSVELKKTKRKKK